ncbi:MAG TPA: hypothetical protein VHU42_02720, partial [Rhodopila sp.]|nr:hypothetical protein [Rhodopila sp.]
PEATSLTLDASAPKGHGPLRKDPLLTARFRQGRFGRSDPDAGTVHVTLAGSGTCVIDTFVRRANGGLPPGACERNDSNSVLFVATKSNV